ncbi:hypothetical protein GCM10009854_11770 [Saccharopolyspora halophila]|uniref:Xylan alpha-1,2-glucuronidase n=1 Tax=Saccharopolyspora halophila TaxID=405551 RepID=A0ABN3FTG7_9PSEU
MWHKSLKVSVALVAPVALAVGLLGPAAAAEPPEPGGRSAFDDSYDGSQMWLNYVRVGDDGLRGQYARRARAVVVQNADADESYRHTPDLRMEPGSEERLATSTLGAARAELTRGFTGLLGEEVAAQPVRGSQAPDGAVVVGTPESSEIVRAHAGDLSGLADDGYRIRTVRDGGTAFTVVAAKTDIGALYGSYALLRRMQTHESINHLDIDQSPKIDRRHLNYWETTRLYAGNDADGTGGLNGESGTIFNFEATGASADRNLPVILDRYIVMARALASVGITGITINNVNAEAKYLTPEYIEQEAALADALRPYGIELALSIRYDAPTDERFAPDTLTEDQLDPTRQPFRDWWHRHARQVKQAIPDLQGFTVKANSEGEPGPQDFGHDHGDGANGIAAAVEPLGMTVDWRTFLYDPDVDNDRLKRAYLEFNPIDDEPQPDGTEGRFADNVFLQTKNGPLDFQAREPLNPMFGRMDNTKQAMELQITQEYTGQSTMLDYLAPMWQEVLRTDTHATDVPPDKRLAGNIVDGSAYGGRESSIVGVANLGNADNLTGHHFSQSNLFAFGRLAWDWEQDSRQIAADWTRMTWSNDQHVVDTVVRMMMGSNEALVDYQTPLGVAHQFTEDQHYDPNPSQFVQKDDWSPRYYNKADTAGLGYDRSPSGSDFTSQYFPALAQRYGNLESTPEKLLMWFHHVPWDHVMDNGKPFWRELVHRYQRGVQYVTWMREAWDGLEPHLDARRFQEVSAKLAEHEADAANWRDTCVAYWQEFSEQPIPTDDGLTSASITVGGTTFDGFDLSRESYRIPVPAGGSPEITEVRTADPRARAEIVSQAGGTPGTAVVKVRSEAPYGPVVKNYRFEMVTDTTLRSLSVNGEPLESFDPRRLDYNAVLPAGSGPATVDATATDPAATVHVEQADNATGRAKVVVSNQDTTATYAVRLSTAINGSDEFTGEVLGEQWNWVREDAANWRVGDGALSITSQRGDLQADDNTAKNLALQEVNGDWSAETRVSFSRPIERENEQAGLLAYADDDNYVKLAWEMADVGAEINERRLVLLSERDGEVSTQEITGANAQRLLDGGALWLRLTKTGDAYRAYYSTDGETYRFFGPATMDRNPTGAGLMAFNRAGESTDLAASFGHFRIRSEGEEVPAA